jgi:hypothetical protein
VVFVIILLLYAFVGFNLLGHKLEGYRTFGLSVNSMCSMIVFDDTVSFADMMDIAPTVGPLFYWSYFILSSLMLINVLLAILLDAYASVAHSAKTANFIWVDLTVQLRLLREHVARRRGVYADVRAAASRIHALCHKRSRLNLAQVYSLLTLAELPPFVVWNVVLVLERKCRAEAEDGSMEDVVAKLLELNKQMAAQLSYVNSLVAQVAGAPETPPPPKRVAVNAEQLRRGLS